MSSSTRDDSKDKRGKNKEKRKSTKRNKKKEIPKVVVDDTVSEVSITIDTDVSQSKPKVQKNLGTHMEFVSLLSLSLS